MFNVIVETFIRFLTLYLENIAPQNNETINWITDRILNTLLT